MMRLLVRPVPVLAALVTAAAAVTALTAAPAHASTLCGKAVPMPSSSPVSTLKVCLNYDTSFGHAYGYAQFNGGSAAINQDDDSDSAFDDSSEGDPWFACTITVKVLVNGKPVSQGNVNGQDCAHRANDPSAQNFETTVYVPLVRGANYSVSATVDGNVHGRSVVVNDERSPSFRAP
jgi:hypothetical protein